MTETTASSQETTGNKKKLYIIFSGIGLLIILMIVLIFGPLKNVFFNTQAAPEIRLVLVEIPFWDEEEERYYFHIEALVKGNPEPAVLFNRNDEPSDLDPYLATVIMDPGESFTLEATAVNSLGSAKASLSLTADEAGIAELIEEDEDETEDAAGTPPPSGSGSPPPSGNGGTDDDDADDTPGNIPPVINSVGFSEPFLYTNQTYQVNATVTDSDGDPISYSWQVLSGDTVIHTSTANPMSWTTPSNMGEYDIRLAVDDGRGGEDNFEGTVKINGLVKLDPVGGEGGYIVKDITIYEDVAHGVGAGDTTLNRSIRGFISFDVSHLAGATIHEAELRLGSPAVFGSPSLLHGGIGLWLGVVNWGSHPLALGDYHLPGVAIKNFDSYDITLTSSLGSNPLLAQQLQSAFDSSSNRFQLRLHFAVETANPGVSDGILYQLPNIYLKIWYE